MYAIVKLGRKPAVVASRTASSGLRRLGPRMSATIPTTVSTHRTSIEVGALRLGPAVSSTHPPRTFGGRLGTPTNGNARVDPIASGRANWSAVVGTNFTPNR